jgi:hypothetical protein
MLNRYIGKPANGVAAIDLNRHPRFVSFSAFQLSQNLTVSLGDALAMRNFRGRCVTLSRLGKTVSGLVAGHTNGEAAHGSADRCRRRRPDSSTTTQTAG